MRDLFWLILLFVALYRILQLPPLLLFSGASAAFGGTRISLFSTYISCSIS